METLLEEKIICPYCGESVTVLVDPGDAGQEYIEDCQVCCRPITFIVAQDMGGDLLIQTQSENDV